MNFFWKRETYELTWKILGESKFNSKRFDWLYEVIGYIRHLERYYPLLSEWTAIHYVGSDPVCLGWKTSQSENTTFIDDYNDCQIAEHKL